MTVLTKGVKFVNSVVSRNRIFSLSGNKNLNFSQNLHTKTLKNVIRNSSTKGGTVRNLVGIIMD